MLEQIDFTESIRNAQINHGVDSFQMQEDDLQISETDFKAQTSTVLMIDISHSMILYGEDRITPAKKVAMALSELITDKVPERYAGHCGVWQRCLADRSERPALPAGGALPYQYRCGAGTGDGYPAQKEKRQQADFYDHGWQTYLPQNREKVLQKQLWFGSQGGKPLHQPGRAV